MQRFVKKIGLKLNFSAFSASPVINRYICDLQQANIRHIAGKIQQKVQKRIMVPKVSPGGNIKRQFDKIPQ